ncbi:uncharacterized protein LOC126092674 [Schistocerca cancellata]|uniref:uncharacterized protein LOC126092674 n=1 Tax=Schistocerca cancellata TaxID=274614 RepID=UPI002118FF7E|nr:uncharacterized protein LOC126092674 [Schistocerca cancellata]
MDCDDVCKKALVKPASAAVAGTALRAETPAAQSMTAPAAFIASQPSRRVPPPPQRRSRAERTQASAASPPPPPLLPHPLPAPSPSKKQPQLPPTHPIGAPAGVSDIITTTQPPTARLNVLANLLSGVVTFSREGREAAAAQPGTCPRVAVLYRERAATPGPGGGHWGRVGPPAVGGGGGVGAAGAVGWGAYCGVHPRDPGFDPRSAAAAATATKSSAHLPPAGSRQPRTPT